MHNPAMTRKTPAQVIAFSMDKKVVAHAVATSRLLSVATDMPFDRTDVVNTSAGINQAHGPIPTPKNDMYPTSPIIVKLDVPVEKAKSADRTSSDTIIPAREMKHRRRRPI